MERTDFRASAMKGFMTDYEGIKVSDEEREKKTVADQNAKLINSPHNFTHVPRKVFLFYITKILSY